MSNYDTLKNKVLDSIKENIYLNFNPSKETKNLIIEIAKPIIVNEGYEFILDVAKTNIYFLKKNDKNDEYQTVLGTILHNILNQLILDLKPIVEHVSHYQRLFIAKYNN